MIPSPPLFKGFSLCGARSAPHQKPPAMRWGQPALQSRPLAGHLRLFRPQGIRVERAVVAYGQKAYSLSHTKWMCKYHVVFTPKYRRKVIYNQIRSDLGEIFRKLCQYKG